MTEHDHTIIHTEKSATKDNTQAANVKTLWYADGCIRFRVFESPLWVYELYISGTKDKPSVITVGTTRDKVEEL